MNKARILIIIAVITIVFTVVLSITVFSVNPKKQVSIDEITPTLKKERKIRSTINSSLKLTSGIEYSSEAAEANKIPYLLGDLLEKLPHTEDSFSLSYVYSNDSFILKLNKENSIQALADFEKFLNLNGLKKSDLESLKTQHQ